MEDKRLLRLIKRARFGDKEAFCEIIKEKSRKILFISTNLMGNSSDGEDVAQEAVITLAQKIGTLKKAELFDAWMYRIVFNVCMDEKRRQSRKPDESGEIDTAVATIAEDHTDVLPEQSVLKASDKEIIMEALNELPERYRICMILFYYEDMSYAEIAETMQVSEQVVANILNRAKEKLRTSLGSQKAEELGFTQKSIEQGDSKIVYKAGVLVPALALSQAFAMSEAVTVTPSAISGLASVAAGVAFPKGLIFTQFIESVAAKVAGALASSAVVVGTLFMAVSSPEETQPMPDPDPIVESAPEPQAPLRSASVVGLPEGAITTVLREDFEDAALQEFKESIGGYSLVTSTESQGSIYNLYQSNQDQNQFVLTIEWDS